MSENTPAVERYRYPCCGAWWEDGCQCEDEGVLGVGTNSAAASDETSADWNDDDLWYVLLNPLEYS